MLQNYIDIRIYDLMQLKVKKTEIEKQQKRETEALLKQLHAKKGEKKLKRPKIDPLKQLDKQGDYY